MSRRVIIAAAVAAVVVVGAVAAVALWPAPAVATSPKVKLGETWRSPYGVAWTYDRWQNDSFHFYVENEAGERQGVFVLPQGAEAMRETYGVPWHVVSFEGMTSDGSDWVVVEASNPRRDRTGR